jgi:hypothetical protein
MKERNLHVGGQVDWGMYGGTRQRADVSVDGHVKQGRHPAMGEGSAAAWRRSGQAPCDGDRVCWGARCDVLRV